MQTSCVLGLMCAAVACVVFAGGEADAAEAIAAPHWTLVRDVDVINEAPVAELGQGKVASSLIGQYREAGPLRNDRFAYLFKLSGPRRLVRCTVTHPDDGIRVTMFCPTFPKWPGRPVAGMEMQPLGSGFISGLQYRPSMTMVTREFVFFSPEQELGIVIQTGVTGQPAAAARIKLEEARAGESFGPATPRPALGAKDHRRTGLYWEDPVFPQVFTGWAGTDGAKFDQAMAHALNYLDWTAQDLLVYPIVWYGRSVYKSKVEDPAPNDSYLWPYMERNHPADFHKRMAAACDLRDVRFIAAINQWKFCMLLKDFVPREKIIAGESTIQPVKQDGSSGWNDDWNASPVMNILHPTVQQAAFDLLDEMVNDLKGYGSFGGVQLQFWRVLPWGLGPGLSVSYDDWTIEQFCKDHDLTPPGEPKAEARFKQRADWILTDPTRKEQWIRWRMNRMTDFYTRVADRIAQAKPDAKLYMNIVFPAPIYLDLSTREQDIRENGFDLDALSQHPAIVIDRGVGQLGQRARQHKVNWVAFDQYDLSSWFQKRFMNRPRTAVTMHQQYFESHAEVRTSETMLHLPEPWEIEGHGRLAQPLPTGRYFLEYYARSLNLFDPMSIAVGGFSIGTQGAEPEIIEFASAFRSLPTARFAHVNSTGEIVLKTAEAEGSRWYYAVNITDTVSELPLKEIGGGNIKDAVTGEEAEFAAGQAATITFKPFELRAWRCDLEARVELGGLFAPP